MEKAENLKKFMKSCGWSQEKVARELKVSTRTVYRWLHGLSKPCDFNTERISALIRKHTKFQ